MEKKRVQGLNSGTLQHRQVGGDGEKLVETNEWPKRQRKSSGVLEAK